MINKIVSIITKIGAKLLAIAMSPIGMIILLVLALMYFGGPLLGSFASGNLGNWDVQSYSNGELVLTIGEIRVHSPGTVGGYIVSARGVSAITNEADCREIGWRWDGEESICYASNEQWLTGKTWTSDITCSCSYWAKGVEVKVVNKYIPDSFDGVKIGEFGDNACVPASSPGRSTPICTGTVTVNIPVTSETAIKTESEVEQETGLQTITVSETETTKTVAYDCISNMQCVKTCGSATPTCTEGKCYCDAKVKTDVVEKTTEEPSTKLSFFTRLKLFLGNIAFKFRSLFS